MDCVITASKLISSVGYELNFCMLRSTTHAPKRLEARKGQCLVNKIGGYNRESVVNDRVNVNVNGSVVNYNVNIVTDDNND